jgi:hypothetical protein
MTLTDGLAFHTDHLRVASPRGGDECVALRGVNLHGCEKSGGAGPSYNAERCEVLLEEPAIGSWAAEAAMTYGVPAVDALELLAYALFLDGEM